MPLAPQCPPGEPGEPRERRADTRGAPFSGHEARQPVAVGSPVTRIAPFASLPAVRPCEAFRPSSVCFGRDRADARIAPVRPAPPCSPASREAGVNIRREGTPVWEDAQAHGAENRGREATGIPAEPSSDTGVSRAAVRK
ncbi:hypothetical protein GCM10010345_39420 [Streptomyces canarius]|uniref:Uncharacterized protein n=1 Tax=Streptomyces canarius TaxID=285453 RepID=A0ABQ3CPR3_9ACTN|nr:hypothetical protein GCM10010345_39420 [Streptomyces canarius]